MCGICGLYKKNPAVRKEELELMANTLIHRGPDSTGFYTSKSKKVGLAHDRLSIIDLSEDANQPMCNEDETIWLVFNGEIYNFKIIRDSLEKKGHRFKSKSDSEVILHLYEEKGASLVEDLNGMFSFCIFDENDSSLFIARDRVGIKPLYYYFRNGVFAFASEVKALLALPYINRDLNIKALDFYFTFGYIPEDLSILEDIKKLKPGHHLQFNGHEVNIKNYWNLKLKRHSLRSFEEEELIDLLEDKLRDAVKVRMISDVPLGTFLSGGLDSSLVTTIMAQESDRPINTFTIGFDSAEHNETPYARIVADDIRSYHKEHFIKIEATGALEKLIMHFDEPFADSSLIPTYYISKVAKESVTVILSGDGGDELFGGYNWYSWVLLLNSLKRRFGSTVNIFSSISRLLPEGFSKKHFLSVLHLNAFNQFLERISFFNSEEKTRLYKNELKDIRLEENPRRNFLKIFECIDGGLIDKMTITDFHYYLPEDILTKVDRASMAVSLETRVPWLDHRLVEFAFSLPSELKINGSRKKYLTKKLAKRILPQGFPLERKQGFCIPLNQWMKGKLGKMLEEELRDGSVEEYLDVEYVNKMLNKNRTYRNLNYGAKLFSILIFAMWCRKYINQE